ncbi:MAG: hypothetical protein KY441_06050, partial [Actinobacteria bacterium]|nr:hypothetical protein [Actinomycetota bacterium]
MNGPRSPSNGFCPRCGAPFPVEFKGEWWETGARCGECGVGSAPQHFLGPSDGEVHHALGDWSLTARTAVTSALLELDIAYRWEAGLVLVVPEAVDDHVGRLLDEVDGAPTAEPPPPPGDLDHGGDDDGSAQAAMAELFDAADRLVRAPADPSRGEAAVAAAATVSSSACPYGLELS